IELGIAWCNGYTPSEVAALSLFSHGPALFLLHYFYNAPATSSLISLAITILSTTVPVALIPPPASKRRAAASAEKEAPEADCGVQVLTTLLAACIHSIVLSQHTPQVSSPSSPSLSSRATQRGPSSSRPRL
ncbi:hypothetical protein V490_03363, partial [Pseudogymnoascus sp. VKM F-3557]